MNSSPSGVTPLVSHLQEIRSNVLAMEQQLRNCFVKGGYFVAADGSQVPVMISVNALRDNSTHRAFPDIIDQPGAEKLTSTVWAFFNGKFQRIFGRSAERR